MLEPMPKAMANSDSMVIPLEHIAFPSYGGIDHYKLEPSLTIYAETVPASARNTYNLYQMPKTCTEAHEADKANGLMRLCAKKSENLNAGSVKASRIRQNAQYAGKRPE